jgi:hypothetical protein
MYLLWFRLPPNLDSSLPAAPLVQNNSLLARLLMRRAASKNETAQAIPPCAEVNSNRFLLQASTLPGLPSTIILRQLPPEGNREI